MLATYSVVVNRCSSEIGRIRPTPRSARLAEQPAITVPTIVLLGADDGVDSPSMEDKDAVHFKGAYRRHILAGIGHNVPEEASTIFPDAVRDLRPV